MPLWDGSGEPTHLTPPLVEGETHPEFVGAVVFDGLVEQVTLHIAQVHHPVFLGVLIHLIYQPA